MDVSEVFAQPTASPVSVKLRVAYKVAHPPPLADEQGGGCEGRALYTSLRVRGFRRMDAVAREDGGTGGGGRVEGREGVVLGWSR
jgi:hypothetical protein